MTPVVGVTPRTVSAKPPVPALLMMYHLLVTGKFKVHAPVFAPLIFRIAYCAVVETMPVAELVPAVFASVTTVPVPVIEMAKPPAMAMSK